MKAMNKQIISLREKIDKIDEELMELLLERIDLAKKVGDLKKKNNMAVEDKQREWEIIERLTQFAKGQIPKDQLIQIFTPVFRSTKQVQNKEKS